MFQTIDNGMIQLVLSLLSVMRIGCTLPLTTNQIIEMKSASECWSGGEWFDPAHVLRRSEYLMGMRWLVGARASTRRHHVHRKLASRRWTNENSTSVPRRLHGSILRVPESRLVRHKYVAAVASWNKMKGIMIPDEETLAMTTNFTTLFCTPTRSSIHNLWSNTR